LGQTPPNLDVHLVRSVAPNKDMFCASFPLPDTLETVEDQEYKVDADKINHAQASGTSIKRAKSPPASRSSSSPVKRDKISSPLEAEANVK